jgi:ADP-heptose:LPS heptosyltransferase
VSAAHNILVIKHGALGDMVLATAGFAAIRAKHPKAHIVLLTTSPYADMMAQSPYFNEIWVDSKPKLMDRKAIKRLRAVLNSKRWEWVYDLQTSTRSTYYQWLLKPPKTKVSNISRFASHGYTDKLRHEKHSLENIRLQLAIAGIHEVGMPDISWLKANISGFALPTPYALLVPGGSAHRPEKRWPAEQYASLAVELAAKKITPVLIGTQSEKAALDSIASRVPQTINLCGKTSFAVLATLARGARLSVGNDTGPMHMIASSNCPSLVLFSQASNPDYSAPVGTSVRILREKDLRALTVDRVLVALSSWV